MSKADLQLLIGSKIPPQAVDVEEIILGCVLLEKDAIDTAIQILVPESFYKPEHNLIFKAVQDLHKNNQPVDLITVTSNLREHNALETIGGSLYLAELSNRIGSVANIEYYCLTVAQNFAKREIIKLGQNIVNFGYNESSDVFDIIEEATAELDKINSHLVGKTYDKTMDYYNNVVQNYHNAKNNISSNNYVSLGFDSFHKKFGLIERGNLVVVAGRPGSGKSTLMVSSMVSSANIGQKSIFFSLEMSAEHIIRNAICSNYMMETSLLRKGALRDHQEAQLYKFKEYIDKGLIIIIPLDSPSIYKIRGIVKKYNKKGELDSMYGDYLQLCESDNRMDNDLARVSTVSRIAKLIAKEQKIGAVWGAQLNREVEKREDKKPILSDLRSSGSVENDSDTVILIYRPEYYLESAPAEKRHIFETYLYEGEPVSTKGKVVLITAKNRDGNVGEHMMEASMGMAYFGDRDIEEPEDTFTYTGELQDWGSTTETIQDNSTRF